MHRIAIAGFQHETNTFVSAPTTLEQFQVADSWPEML
jgi:microcystin degradation protein MlrC